MNDRGYDCFAVIDELRVNYRCLLIIVVIIVLVEIEGAESNRAIVPKKRYDGLWYVYKIHNRKTYRNSNLETKARLTWEYHIGVIYWHNVKAKLGIVTFYLNANSLTDVSTREFFQKFLTTKASSKRRLIDDELVGSIHRNFNTRPKSLDWRKCGFKTEPENQLDCGSCYAYSIAGSISGQLFRRTGKVIELSEQQLVDCSSKYGNLGCAGGSLRKTLEYLGHNKGIMRDKHYPYVAKKGSCKYQSKLSVANVTKWAILPSRDELALEDAVATIGPIAVSVNASPKTFQLYHSGAYNDKTCTDDQINHAMLLVGYTETEWILKNWWGDTWGENGYMRMKKGKNLCGIANYAGYAIIE